ncbi:MAG TPA: hypothetical protein VOA87_19675 [Thermoanaerobaculia bacterium]|nr:hypothetical protein [Thermoanaerobaculia bacterium]
MTRVQVELRDGRLAYHPGDDIEGTARWQLDRPPKSAELRLFWFTEGRGDRDLEVIETLRFDAPAADDHRDFQLHLPAGPYSFAGKLIRLRWAIEVEVEPGSRVARTDLTVAPAGEAIRLASVGG